MPPTTYKQDNKNQARKRLISHAIESLTANRSDARITNPDFIESAYKNYFDIFLDSTSPGQKIRNIPKIRLLLEEVLLGWKAFYNSTTPKKTLDQLKVLFLSGPEPMNDIEVFISQGIQRENIWSIEKDNAAYDLAISQLIKERQYIKLHKGSLKDFFLKNDMIFDIVYFDACSPLISNSGKPLLILKELFYNGRLSDLSALVTNFSEIDSDADETYKSIAAWFLTRNENEYPENTYDIFSEKFLSEDIPLVVSKIHKNTDYIYGHFIRSFISVMGSEIIPMTKNLNVSSRVNKYFNLTEIRTFYKKNMVDLNKPLNYYPENDDPNELLKQIFENTPSFRLSQQSCSLIHFFEHIIEKYSSNPICDLFKNKEGLTLSIMLSVYVSTIIKSFEDTYSDFKDFYSTVCTDEFLNIITKSIFHDRNYRIGCDIPMQNLIADLMYGIYGFPYYTNPSMHLSLSYTAKTRKMFSDVFIFDQARYLFDYLPSIDLFPSFFEIFPYQIIIQACIDSIVRKMHHANSDIFRYGFFNEIGYQKKYPSQFPDRIEIV